MILFYSRVKLKSALSVMNWLHLGLFLFLVYIVVQNGFAVKEGFEMKDLIEQSYLSDVKFVSAYVGPFIGDMYTTLRAKNNDTTIVDIPFDTRLKNGDPHLSDALLPIARQQVISWIDSFNAQCAIKYKIADLVEFRKRNDLEYNKNLDNSLTVNLVADGNINSYIL